MGNQCKDALTGSILFSIHDKYIRLKTNIANTMDKKNRTISDLLGNEYYLQEETDIKGKYLEVYEVVTIDNVKHKTYLLDMDMDINEDVNNLLDEIDDIKAKMKD
jgi:hypothetical protein